MLSFKGYKLSSEEQKRRISMWINAITVLKKLILCHLKLFCTGIFFIPCRWIMAIRDWVNKLQTSKIPISEPGIWGDSTS